MAATQETVDTVAERANQLYWNSQDTVERIVAELGISRSVLYSSLQPFPAGVSCQECGEPLVFANRTSRDNGVATCSACGGREDHVTERTEMRQQSQGNGEANAGWKGGWERWRGELASVEPERAIMVGGAAALGVVIGAVAARAVREMW